MDQRSLFEGDLVVLTAVDPEKDAPQFSSWSLNQTYVLNNFEGFYKPYTSMEIKKKLKETLKKAEEKRNHYYFAVRTKGDEKLVGLLRFGWIQATHQHAMLLLDFENEDVAGQYFNDTLKMALRYAFMELSLHRLVLEIPACNETDIQRFEAAGFLRESQRREAAYWNGKLCDLLVYALLRPEWKARQMEVKK